VSTMGQPDITAPHPDWVAEQLATFGPDDLRHAARVFRSIVAEVNDDNGGA
jgi:hypothetical protein